MAFRHGKSAAVFFNGTNLTTYLNEASVSNSVETAETTTFGSDAKTYVTGLKDGMISAAGMFDGSTGAVDEVIASALGGVNADVITYAPDGAVAGRRSYSAAVRETSYEVTSPVGDVVAVSLEVQADGGINPGYLLSVETGVTASAVGTSIDNTTSSTDGFGYVHVYSNSRDGSSTFKVQHSSDNSTFVDLITFASVSASTTSGERVAVSGTVNRYVRASHVPGGTSGSVTYTMAFARK